jgi:hypothetical protein
MARKSKHQYPMGTVSIPRVFLLGVISEKTTELHLRIEAANALFPYFEARCGSDAKILS